MHDQELVAQYEQSLEHDTTINDICEEFKIAGARTLYYGILVLQEKLNYCFRFLSRSMLGLLSGYHAVFAFISTLSLFVID